MYSCVRLLGFLFLGASPLLIHSFMVYDRILTKFAKLKQNARLLQSTAGTLAQADVGNPLFLTPLINEGKYRRARLEATVPPMIKGVKSFSGFITVNKTCNSNLFFWMFTATRGNWKIKPLIAWFQGGPGGTSQFGNLREVGPIFVDEKGKLQRRKYAWNQNYNIIFIDNPVGAGFSFTDSESCFATTGDDVTRDLYEFFIQFYKMFSMLKNNKLYLTGESYAGKYIPSLAHHISVRNKDKKLVIPLAGVLMISPFMDPMNMMVYGDYVFQLGFVDRDVRSTIYKYEDNVRTLIGAKQNFEAWKAWSGGIMDTIGDNSGLGSAYNYINDDALITGLDFLSKPETRKAIHVGKREFNDLNEKVYEFLLNDTMNSVAPLIEDLLNWGEIDVVTVSGQLDIITAYPLSENVYSHLKWKNALEYKKAARCQYTLGNNVVGYYKNVGTFTELMFRDCGHMLPEDCPAAAFDLLNKVLTNITSLKCV